MRFCALVLVSAIGCTSGSVAVLADRNAASREALTGAWDVILTLEHPYPLGFSNPPARQVCGTIGFVDDMRSSEVDVDRQANAVYSIPISRIGLDWLNDSKFPSAIAQRSETDSPSIPDSVTIILNPESRERIQLRGVRRMAEIDGKWTAQSARGTASGQFKLRPHQTGACEPANE